MAYVYARTKTGKPFKMGIEDKHIYKNFTQQYIEIAKNPNSDAAVDMTNNNPYCVNAGKMATFDITNGFVVPQGTDENQRVGNKVFLKFIDLTYNITISGANYATYFSHGQAIDTYYRFRVMVVQFDYTVNNADIADWFRETYTYFREKPIHNENAPLQSVHTAKLRESTPHTGQFRILYDKKTCLKKNKTVKMSTIKIPVKQNINFENTNNKPTDDSMKRIYLIVIGPCYNEVDMDSISNDKTYSLNADLYLFHSECVAKYEYYDL